MLLTEVRSGELKNKESASLALIINGEHLADGNGRMWSSNSRLNGSFSVKLLVLLDSCFQEKLMKITCEA